MARHDVVFNSNINVVQHANLFLVIANEVTSIMGNQQWISVHVYVAKYYLTHSQLFEGPKSESQTEYRRKGRSRGTLLGSQHFRRVEGHAGALGWD
jgi:hypothetical protein